MNEKIITWLYHYRKNNRFRSEIIPNGIYLCLPVRLGHWKRLGRIWIMGLVDLLWGDAIQISGKVVDVILCSRATQLSLSHISPWLQQGWAGSSRRWGPLKPRSLVYPKPGVYIYGISCEGEVPIRFMGKWGKYLHPKVSHWHPNFYALPYATDSSAGLMISGWGMRWIPEMV